MKKNEVDKNRKFNPEALALPMEIHPIERAQKVALEHTIAEGDPYCSRVLHDTRVDWKLYCPPIEFWDGFNPEE